MDVFAGSAGSIEIYFKDGYIDHIFHYVEPNGRKIYWREVFEKNGLKYRCIESRYDYDVIRVEEEWFKRVDEYKPFRLKSLFMDFIEQRFVVGESFIEREIRIVEGDIIGNISMHIVLRGMESIWRINVDEIKYIDGNRFEAVIGRELFVRGIVLEKNFGDRGIN